MTTSTTNEREADTGTEPNAEMLYPPRPNLSVERIHEEMSYPSIIDRERRQASAKWMTWRRARERLLIHVIQSHASE